VLGGAELDPLVAETGRDARRPSLQHPSYACSSHDAEDAACAHLLQREQVAALMMHAGEAVADELLEMKASASRLRMSVCSG
jgi:hypothetical protein